MAHVLLNRIVVELLSIRVHIHAHELPSRTDTSPEALGGE